MDIIFTEKTMLSGVECLQMSNQYLTLQATTQVGPCILFFAEKQQQNLLIQTPNLEINTPWGAKCPIYGGHRIWVAPETFEITYAADNMPVNIVQTPTAITFEQSNFGQPFLKSLTIELQQKKVFLTHKITNLQAQQAHCACWTITMLQAGGKAFLPLKNQTTDPQGLQPTQQINLWQYTDLGSGFIEFSKNNIAVNAQLNKGNLKIGSPESTGELRYLMHNKTFVKSFDTNYIATFDKNSKAEIYCCPQYIELEAIGEQHALQTGETACFKEMWQMQ